ncbi:MAG: carboxypeptidase-like regulatory domain-containing protein [Bacteroidetes bacterium]|nr:carboxypeptidase-like regulatory domain-containing protein [Bacteroidota bacterium]
MKRLLLHIFAIFVPILIYGQTYTSVLKGTIIDKDSRQPLTGVNVAVVSVSPVVGATTDDKGFFAIRGLPTGRVNIKMTYIGYEDAYMGQILVGTGKETYLNIEMQEKISSMTEVVVDGGKDKSRPNNNFATVSATSFSVEQTKRYAGTLNDPSRMVQTFPGVVSSGDDNNAIVIRGNSPRGLLWRMEGIEIPNPNHFAGSEGSTGGGVSILSANMLANTDFYTGAFPAQYGNATSGVFDLNLRKGNQDKREYTLQVGVLGLEAALEGPFSKKYKGSYLINYRYSTLNILALMGLPIGGNQVPKYQDLSFNFSFPTQHIGNFTLFGIGGISSLGNNASGDTTKFVTLSDRTEEKLSQKVGVVGVTHTFLFKDHKTSLKSVLSLSGTDNGYGEDTVDNQLIKAPLQNNNFRYVYIRGATNLNRKVDTRNTVMAGVSFQIINYRLHQDGLNDTTGVYSTQIDTRGLTYLLEGYWQWRHRFSDRLFLSGGLHLTYGGINNKFYVEPRIGGEYRLTEKMNLTAGIGLHSRMDAVSTYMSQLPAGSTYDLNQNRHLDFSRSAHFVLGYNWNFAKDFRLRAEVYYQYLFSVPVGVGANGYFSVINLNDGFVNMPLVSTGKGRNYGLEITVEKYFTHNYYFLYTLSLFDSKYKGTDGVWRNTIYNSNYVMNLLGGKEFIVGKRKINRIGVNAKIIWRGGTRDTPIDISASEAAGTTVYDNSQTNAIRLPDYFRVDFGANYRRNKKKYDWMLSLDIQNVINRENVAYRSYDRYAHAIVYKRNLGIIPVLSYKVEF